MSAPLRLVDARVLTPEGLVETPLRMRPGVVCEDGPGREVDPSGCLVLAGIVDIHGDGFERHLAPRRRAVTDLGAGLCDALTSDYHSPSLREATLQLADQGACDPIATWRLVSAGPARLLGPGARGTPAPGQRADLAILDRSSGDVCATLSAGGVTHMRGEMARRLIG